MRISFAGVASRVWPPALRNRLLPLANTLDATLAGDDERAVSRRVALVAFTTRIISSFLALGSQVLMARWMGELEYGVFVVVWVAAVIVGVLS